MNEIVNLISTVGFPIVACLGLGYFIKATMDAQREDTRADKERMYQQLDKFGSILDESTKTIDRLNTRLDVLEGKIDNLGDNS